jgi:multidrug efflux system membrane fusion protein
MLKDNELQIEHDLDHPPRTEPDIASGHPPSRKGKRTWLIFLGLLVVGVGIAFALSRARQRSPESAGKTAAAPGKPGSFPVPVVAGTVATQDVPIYLDGLGTVQAFNTVTVRARVDGQIDKILFTEGQEVHAGDLLAQIDPSPYQAQVDQNLAKQAEDEAQLAVAQLTLKRDAELLGSKILSQQDYDTQKALVDQLAATVKADQAAVESARVQLNYTHIVSPLDGRVGIRLVDQGNLVHANDPNGIVVITQLHPISVIFTLPEQDLAQIQPHLAKGETLTVLAVDRSNRYKLAEGKLAVVDNQIDTTTGTIRLKAIFENADLRLWPGQFVNARLLRTTVKGGIVVPAQVVQRGPEESAFVFVIKPDLTVAVRDVKVAQIDQGVAMISDGLKLGERVVVDGQAKLQPGSHVKVGDAPRTGQGGRGGTRPDSDKSAAR